MAKIRPSTQLANDGAGDGEAIVWDAVLQEWTYQGVVDQAALDAEALARQNADSIEATERAIADSNEAAARAAADQMLADMLADATTFARHLKWGND